jgi:fermentation-respiration switch protein FrsA (DUF1100 family)
MSNRPTPTSWAPLAGLAAIAGLGAALYLVEAGRRGAAELLAPVPVPPVGDPERYGLAAEAVRIPTTHGLTLGAWYVPAAQPTDRAVALFHGHTADRSQLLPYARFLSGQFNCLLVDFRNSGDSEGDRSSMGHFEADDVEAAVDWLRARGNRRIGGLGVSMGGAALVRAAARNPLIAAVVTDGTFDRLAHVVAQRARVRHYPLPGLVARAIVAEAGRRLGAPLTPDPVALVGRIAPRPVLIVHGERDATSAIANGHRLFAAANEPKEFLWLPDAAHARSWEAAPLEVERRVGGFFRRHL